MQRFYKKYRAYIRLLSVVIAITTVAVSVVFSPSVPAFSAKDPVPYIVSAGKEITTLDLHQEDKIRIDAVSTLENEVGYCWQIKDTDSDRWFDVSGVHSKSIFVTYALVSSMLDLNQSAYIRCRLTDGDDVYYTDSVRVNMIYSVSDGVDPAVALDYESPAPMRFALKRSVEEPETHSIVINYLFDNNAVAFEPYGASVARGSDFTATVTSPTVVGYAPYRRVGDDYIEADTVLLDYTDITQDITVNIIYRPALVDFSVHHHLQNLYNDDYSETYDYITTSKALTGSVVGDGLHLTEAQLPGFRPLAYEHLTVAADGSTVIEIRYDRNYYLIDFDMAGGYGTEPVYSRYGASVGANVPIRHGYVFDGWELVSYGGNTPTAEQKEKYELQADSVITVPDANLRYRAKWITQMTTYTLVFWRENANDNNYSYWGNIKNIPAMSGTVVDGEDRVDEVASITDEAYFTFNSYLTDTNVIVEGDGSTVVNVYYSRNYYKIYIKDPKYNCTIEKDHQHDDECTQLLCGYEHEHTEECEFYLACNLTEHTAHTPDCIVCGMTEHEHGDVNCTCTLSEHTHSTSCYRNVGSKVNRPSNAPSNPSQGQIYRTRSWYGYSYSYYIYIGDSWYNYSGTASNNTIIAPSCSKTEHTHSDSCCATPEHSHVSSCYRDVIHTHSDDCYGYSCGFENEHTHTDGCYRYICGIEENHTCTSACKNTIKYVYRKYEQSIADIWPITGDNGKTYDDGQRWEPSGSTYYDQVLVYLSTMVPDDFTLTLNEANYDTFHLHYYLQTLPGQTGDRTYSGNSYKLNNTISANYNYVTEAEDFFDIAGYEQFASTPAFSNGQIDNVSDVYFYYNRTRSTLQFDNNGRLLSDKTQTNVMYEMPLEQFYFEPEYPDNLEPNAYEFEGWYTTAECYPGTKVDWSTVTMPDGDLLLYANWAPVLHTVDVYKDATLSEQIGETQSVAHNAFATAPHDAVVNGNYVFQGWFYKDENGVEKAFVFSGIPITKDLKIYAKWSSHVSVDYEIHYRLYGTDEPIADSTYGSAIAGHNKTFDAKAGDQLYKGFTTGYFPLVNSHTITMSVDGNHSFTFYYVYVPSMPYTVRYVNALTGEDLCPPKTVADNNFSVVTENFVQVPGMMPDAYQKRLVLSADGEDLDGDGALDNNNITFYYSSDDEHAYYRVVHYIENIAQETYREYRAEDTVGNIGQEYTFEAITISGFEFNPDKTKVNSVLHEMDGTSYTAKLDENGLLVEFYYDRIEVPYTVKYIDGQTGNALAPDKTGRGIFGDQVTEYALDLESKGYSLASEDIKILTLSANETHNVIEFIYQQKYVGIKYQTVGPEGCGILTQESENVAAVSGQPNGSAPIASKGFAFEGWYTDPECTVPVDSALVGNDDHFKPKKADDEVWQDGTTYYAKFYPLATELTITTKSTDAIDGEQAYIFTVKGTHGTNTEGIDLTVTVIGDGSVTITELPLGDYVVTELTDWSWRYENSTAERAVTLVYDASKNVVIYDNTRTKDKWLDGNASRLNRF